MKIHDPNRESYIKGLEKEGKKSCHFCDAKFIREQVCRGLDGKYWKIWVNRYPYMDGNLMIIPKRHIKFIDEIDKEEWSEFHDMILKSQKMLDKIFQTNDFNISINIGRNAGASLDHMHWQIIPRRKGHLMNSVNIFSDLYSITIEPKKLKIIIDNESEKLNKTKKTNGKHSRIDKIRKS